MPDLFDIPLFPLGTVLFPRQHLPLHIFEQRYQVMIGECLEQSAPFGVVLIREGREVGAPAVPHRVGTTARILEAQPLGEGRMGLQTVGDRVFRIQELTQLYPFMRGKVEYLEYPPAGGDSLSEVLASVRERFDVHLDILSNLAGKERPALDLDVSPDDLSYVVASIMAIQNEEKQQLLQVETAAERLRLQGVVSLTQ